MEPAGIASGPCDTDMRHLVWKQHMQFNEPQLAHSPEVNVQLETMGHLPGRVILLLSVMLITVPIQHSHTACAKTATFNMC